MIPKDDNYSNTQGSLPKIRKVLTDNKIDPKTDRRNIVRIHTAIHKTTLSHVYKDGIIRAFGGLQCSEILLKLRTLRVILEQLTIIYILLIGYLQIIFIIAQFMKNVATRSLNLA